ncbi:GGDEF domain-containing protein [Halomonas sp. HNIBRBA4712]|uniref:GGDEF domain-containing protein n=1 Tax=Halomonas sp. HNIBRBA4712 TaxID=3373087 RepID=UPI003745E13F
MEDETLSTAVEAELSRKEPRLHFPPALEGQFEIDTQQQRQRGMLFSLLIATPLYFVFLINDFTSRSEIFGFILWVRLGAVLVIGVPVFWLLHRGVTPFWRETLVATVVVSAMVASCIVLRASSSAYSYYDVYCFGLILVVGNTFFPLRFVYACVATAICVAVMLFSITGYAPMSADAKQLACLGIFATALFTLVTCYRLERTERRAYLLILRERIRSGHYLQDNQELSRLSLTDPLTNIGNRRQFEATLAARWQAARERKSWLSLLVIDVDHFKHYNDHYGHLPGDECLRHIAAALQVECREADQVARIGGEEFVQLMPHTAPESAYKAGERIRRRIEALALPNPGKGETAVITVSVGVAALIPNDTLTPTDLLAQADAALYRAKQSGRNRTCMAEACAWQSEAQGIPSDTQTLFKAP